MRRKLDMQFSGYCVKRFSPKRVNPSFPFYRMPTYCDNTIWTRDNTERVRWIRLIICLPTRTLQQLRRCLLNREKAAQHYETTSLAFSVYILLTTDLIHCIRQITVPKNSITDSHFTFSFIPHTQHPCLSNVPPACTYLVFLFLREIAHRLFSCILYSLIPTLFFLLSVFTLQALRRWTHLPMSFLFLRAGPCSVWYFPLHEKQPVFPVAASPRVHMEQNAELRDEGWCM